MTPGWFVISETRISFKIISFAARRGSHPEREEGCGARLARIQIIRQQIREGEREFDER